MEEEEPFDSLSGPPPAATMSSRPNPSPPPMAAFGHNATSGNGEDGIESPGDKSGDAPIPSRPSGSPPPDAFGLPQRWSHYEKEMETHRTESSLEASKSTAATTQSTGVTDSITPSKDQPQYYTNYNLLETPSPSGPPGSRPSTLPSGPPGGASSGPSYDTAKLIEKYAMYRAPPPTVAPLPPPAIRNPSPMQSRDLSIRNQAIKMLDLVDDRLGAPVDVRRTTSGGFRASASAASPGADDISKPYNVRRTASGSVVQEPNDASKAASASDGYYMRRTLSSGSNGGKRVPAALAGLNLSNEDRRGPTPRGRGQPGRYSFTDPNFRDDDHISDEEDDILRGPEVLDDLVDQMLGEDGNGDQDPLVDYKDNRAASSSYSSQQGRSSSSWSSRYMYQWSQEGILDRMDRQHNRQNQRQPSRNMFASSAHTLRNAVSSQKGGVFGSGFSFRQNHVFGRKQDNLIGKPEVNLRTAWADTGEDEGLVASTSGRKTWQEAMLNKHRRRRYMAFLLIILSAIVILIAGMTGLYGRSTQASAAPLSSDDEIGSRVTIYVTSDVPYSTEEESKLQKDLDRLPSDATFMVHLGNIQEASVTQCPKARYSHVSSILQQSPVPMFVLPGEEDWVFCPNPEIALAHWTEEFALFEENFENNLQVFRPRDRPENFCVLHHGVLFVGLHLVGGPINDTDDWRQRGLDMLEFYFGMLNLHKDSFRSIVLLGNARPGPAQEEFFNGLVSGIKPVGKPIAYVHGNPGEGGVRQYTPFDDYPEVVGIEIEDGGVNPPLRLTVGFGEHPFLVG